MITTADKLQIKRESAVARMQEIVEAAEAANRPLSDDEQREFDQLDDGIRQNDGTLDRRQRLDARLAADAPEVFPGGHDPRLPVRVDKRTSYEPAAVRPLLDGNGRVTRGLLPGESFRSCLPPNLEEEDFGLGLGDIARVMACGPQNKLEARALSVGVDASGGYSVPALVSAMFFDRLRPYMAVAQAGAESIPLTGGESTTFATIATDPGIEWLAESAESSEDQPTIGSVTLTQKTARTCFRASREVLQDSVNINSMIETACARAFANEIDRVCLEGAAANGEPVGLLSISGINESNVNGSITDWSDLSTAFQLCLADNASLDNFSVIMSPTQWATYDQLVDGTEGNPLRPLPSVQKIIDANRWFCSQNVTAGTVYAGDFRELVVGLRLGFTLEVLKERYAEHYEYAFLAVMRLDVAVKRGGAFVRLINIS